MSGPPSMSETSRLHGEDGRCYPLSRENSITTAISFARREGGASSSSRIDPRGPRGQPALPVSTHGGVPRRAVKWGNLSEGTLRSKGRRRKMEPNEGTMNKTQGLANISTKLIRIANTARETQAPLTTLSHHVDMDWMHKAYRRTRKDGALGIDGRAR
jgi:hypothetical protein